MHACAYFCYKRVHCGIWDKCTVGFVKLIYCMTVVIPREERLSLVLSTTNVSAWRCVLPEIWRGVSLAVTLCSDVIISAMASQITGVSIVYSTVCSGADQRKHQSSPSRAFGRKEIIGDRWIPRTKVQYRGKCFHLVTSLGQWWIVQLDRKQIWTPWMFLQG